MKKRIYAIIVGVFTISLAVCSTGNHFFRASELGNNYAETTLQHGSISLNFTEEGTTSISNVMQFAEFDVTAAEIAVEEVCVAAGDIVEEGDALYKLSEESIAEAVTCYEEAVSDAEKEIERARAAYETGKLKAEYTLESSKASLNSAADVYNTASSALDQAVTEAETALADARTQIAAYQSNLDNNTYYSDAGITEKKNVLSEKKTQTKEAKKTYEKAKEAYESLAATVNTQIAQLQSDAADAADLPSVVEKINQLAENNKALAEKKAALDAEEEKYKRAQEAQAQAQQAYDTAMNSYDKSVSEASMKIENLENSLSSLEEAYSKAVNEAKTGKVDAKNTYDAAVLEGEYAQSVYDSSVNSLQNAIDAAENTLEKLEKGQDALLALKDGVVCANQSGTLAEVSYEIGNCLNTDTALVSYCNTDTIMVSVEVSQEDIAHIAVGDTTEVYISGVQSEKLEGTIASIASEATADGSMSHVTYEAVINIDNSEGMISSGSAAYITFPYGELENVDYITTAALSDINGSTAKVRKYDAAGEIEEVQVRIGESTEEFTVITEGITEEDVCLIEGGSE